jgi:hypothetical protein
LDWPQQRGGEYRVLRKGTNEWTCLPGVPGYSHDEPGCFDPVFMQGMKDSLAGRTPHITTVGIAYMYIGAWVPNESRNGSSGGEFHVGPHIMVDRLQFFLGSHVGVESPHSFHTSPVPDAFMYVRPFLFSSSLGFSLTSWSHHVDSSTAGRRCLTVLSRLFSANPLFTIEAMGLSLALRLHKRL